MASFALAALLWSGTGAWAYPVMTGTLSVSGALAPGNTVTVSGGGYASGTEISVDLYSVALHLRSVNADGAGDFSATVTLLSNLSAGKHTLQATGSAANGGVLVLSRVFTVAAAGDGDADDMLPVTGTSMIRLTGTGLGALLVGAAVLWYARRSRSPISRGGSGPVLRDDR